VQKHERPPVAEFVLTHEPITDPHLTEFWLAVHRPSLDRHDRRHRRLGSWWPRDSRSVGRGDRDPPGRGIDAVVEARFAEGTPKPNALCALQILIAPEYRGQV
jgi:hypothetical protein